MNKQKFIEYIRKPVDLNDQTLAELEELIDEYPFFQSARTLLAKGSKINKSPKTSARINSAAIYATDRVLLKRYINDELIFLNPVQVHESHEAEHERDLGKALKSNRQVTTKHKTEQVSSKEQAPSTPPKPAPAKQAPKSKDKKQTTRSPEAKPPALQEPSSLDHIIDELYRDMEELKANRAKFREWETKLEEDEAVDKAVKKATQKANTAKAKESTKQEAAGETQKAEQPKEAPEKTAAQKTKPTPKNIEEKESKPTKELGAEAEAPKEETPKKPAQSRSARKTPAKPKEKTSAKKKPAATKKPASKKTPKAKTSKSTKKTEEPKAEKANPEEPAQANKRKSDQESIISNFIKTNPSISPADGKTKAEEDLSGGSTVLHPDLASEYLAEIYLEQGKKDTARKIYENLMVRFPEKKVYFAEIIKKLN